MSSLRQRIDSLITRARAGHTFKLEKAILKFTEQVYARMDVLAINSTVLAERLHVSPAYVSKILRGKTNFTLDSLIRISTALDAEYCFEIKAKQGASSAGYALVGTAAGKGKSAAVTTGAIVSPHFVSVPAASAATSEHAKSSAELPLAA